jgi:hypothetical protein
VATAPFAASAPFADLAVFPDLAAFPELPESADVADFADVAAFGEAPVLLNTLGEPERWCCVGRRPECARCAPVAWVEWSRLLLITPRR